MSTKENYVEAKDEPQHKVVLENDYVRIIRVQFPPKAVTQWHRHSEDSFYIHLETMTLCNEVVGKEPKEISLSFGGVAYGGHKDEPFVHQITGVSEGKSWDCIDGEILKTPETVSETALEANDNHSVKLEQGRVRIYELNVTKGSESQEVTYNFYSVLTALTDGEITIRGNSTSLKKGESVWLEPGDIKYSNTSEEDFKAYVTEVCK